MMKKFVIILLVLLAGLTCVFAYQNTYRLSSDEVQTFLTLRRLTSTMTPDPTYPVSASQLASLVKSLDTSKLGPVSKAMYDELLEKLEHPQVLKGENKVGADFDLSILGFEVTKSEDPNTYGVLDYNERMPVAVFDGTVYLNEYAAGRFYFDARRRLVECNPGTEVTTVATVFNNFAPFDMKWAEGLPSAAYLSVGAKDVNLIMGRDRLAVGNGFTGNLVLGENVLEDNFIKLSFANNLVSYDFSIDSFNHDDQNSTVINATKKTNYIHRVSFSFTPKMSVSVFEGALVKSFSPFIDIQFFNPFMFMHNTGTYYDASTNNYLGAEFSAMLPENIQIDAQLLVDQFVLPGEVVEKTGEAAYIALLNASTSREVYGGILDVYAEAVYGNPYVYLKNNHGYGIIIDDRGTIRPDYSNESVDLVNDVLSDYNRTNSREKQYFGYKYGGDLFSFGAGAKFVLDGAKYTFDAQFLSKGQNGIWKELGEIRKADKENTVVKQNTFITYLGYENTFLKGIDVRAKLGAVAHSNYRHQAEKGLFDFQFALGVTIRPLEFAKKAKVTLQ